MKQNSKIVALINKVLLENASADEKGRLSEWRNASYDNEVLFQKVANKQRIEASFNVYDQINLEEAFRKIVPQSKGKVRQLVPGWLKYSAAIIILGVLSGITIYLSNHRNTNDYLALEPGGAKAILTLSDGTQFNLEDKALTEIKSNNLVVINDGESLNYNSAVLTEEEKAVEIHSLNVPRGGEYKLTLSDGTSIWLNSETTLKFPSKFSGHHREVELTGEAYFVVAHNEQMPFVVKTGEIKVEVLGTEFNVKSYENELGISTSLMNGKVKVTSGDVHDDRYVLQPGQQAVYNKEKQNIEVSETDVFAAAAWRNGRFVLRRESLANIMNVISRWYDVNVTYADPELQSLLFNVNTYKYSDVGEMLSAIEKTGKVKFEQHKNIIIIKKQ